MSSQLLTSVWLGLLAVVAIEVGLIALLLAVAQRRKASAAWQRTFCQAAVVGVLLITLGEFSGAGRGLATWAAGGIAKTIGGGWGSELNLTKLSSPTARISKPLPNKTQS